MATDGSGTGAATAASGTGAATAAATPTRRLVCFLIETERPTGPTLYVWSIASHESHLFRVWPLCMSGRLPRISFVSVWHQSVCLVDCLASFFGVCLYVWPHTSAVSADHHQAAELDELDDGSAGNGMSLWASEVVHRGPPPAKTHLANISLSVSFKTPIASLHFGCKLHFMLTFS